MAEPEPEGSALPEGEPENGCAEGQDCKLSGDDMDLVLPSVMICIIMIIGVLILSLKTQTLWWSKCIKQIYYWKLSRKVGLTEDRVQQRCPPDCISQLPSSHSTPSELVKCDSVRSSTRSIFSSEEEKLSDDLKSFQNNPWGLLRILLPVVLSLSFCPVTLFLNRHMTSFFWPPDVVPERPNINDAIACFLMPAGIVYAVAFGFTFQDVLTKRTLMENNMKHQIQTSELLQIMVMHLDTMTTEQKVLVLRSIKGYCLRVIEEVLCIEEKKRIHVDVGFSDIIALLQKVDVATSNQNQRGVSLYESVFKQTLLMHANPPLNMAGKQIHLVQWLFLECLGYVSFFGVLLVSASSYRLELTLCVLTVVSITAFTYILADFDSLYHGFFQLDLQLYTRLLEKLNSSLHQLMTKPASSETSKYNI